MKKLLLVLLVFVLAFTLAGCRDIEQEKIDCDNIGGEWIDSWDTREYCIQPTVLFYTQDEMDTMLREHSAVITEILYDNYVEYDDENKILYTNCVIIDGIKHCDIVFDLNKDYVTYEEYQNLLDRIEILESE